MFLICAGGVNGKMKDEAEVSDEAGGVWADAARRFITGMDEGDGNVIKVIFSPFWWSSVWLSVTSLTCIYHSIQLFSFFLSILQQH